MKQKFLILFLFLYVLINPSQIYSQNNKSLTDNPTQFRQYVVDETGTLTQQQVNDLNNKLKAEDKATTNQIIVYMIPSLKDGSLEDLSIRLAEKNKIGKKDRNNGVLLLVVKDDRKIRIEVGYGLEGVLTDAMSSQIIRKEITPSFKSGNYYEGINKGVDAIINTIKGEYTADKESKESGDNSTCCFGIPIFIIIIFGMIFFFIFISFIKSMTGIGNSIYTSKKGWSKGGWGGFGGGFGGGGKSGGFGGGGGFSGGGGSFGGGGASGSW